MKRLLVCAFSLCFLFLSGVVGLSESAHAWENFPDWSSGAPEVDLKSEVFSSDVVRQSSRTCVVQAVLVDGFGDADMCVTQMNGWRFGSFERPVSQSGFIYLEHYFMVSIGTDTSFYAVDNLSGTTEWIVNAETNTIAYLELPGLKLLKDLPSKLARTEEGYHLIAEASTLRYGGDELPLNVTTAVSSGAGRWLVLETDKGIARVDLENSDVRLVFPFTTVAPSRTNGPISLAISDDGQSIAIGGKLYAYRHLWVVTINDECGTRNPLEDYRQAECPAQEFAGLFGVALPDGWPVGLHFGSHGKRLDLFVQRFDDTYQRASLYPAGSKPAPVRYLALGDSFSSGEGDGDHSFYGSHTDDAAAGEICHTSRRSYPFILSDLGGMNTLAGYGGHAVASVACSGAATADIIGSDGYLGQNGRLKGKSTAALEDLRTAAMRKFIPGRIGQKEFVETYQPQAVTVGIGGNDVQFSQVINMCARSLLTCDYAANLTDRRNLGESIKAMFTKLQSLYIDLAKTNQSGKIFAVGYPKFVNETAEMCPLSTNLDRNEREMINEGVEYINEVTRAAAQSAGVAYIDIQDALAGHTACDDPGGYVNTIDLVGALHGVVDRGTFHPNELGHRAIAQSIAAQLGTGDVAATEYCTSRVCPCPQSTAVPGLPAYFGDATHRPLKIALPSELIRITNSTFPFMVTKGVEAMIEVSGLLRGSSVRIELHSEVIDLGTGVVNESGALSIPLNLPVTTSLGYHTLHVYGSSPSGEPVDMYQIIYVAGSEPESDLPVDAVQITEPRTAPPTETSPPAIPPANEAKSSIPQDISSVIKQLPATLGDWRAISGIIVFAAGLFLFLRLRSR